MTAVCKADLLSLPSHHMYCDLVLESLPVILSGDPKKAAKAPVSTRVTVPKLLWGSVQ